jgi:hypothetical protein
MSERYASIISRQEILIGIVNNNYVNIILEIFLELKWIRIIELTRYYQGSVLYIL